MKPPSKAALTETSVTRYKLVGLVAYLRNPESPHTEDLLAKVMEDADSVLGAGELPDWPELRRIMSGTLKICLEYLEG